MPDNLEGWGGPVRDAGIFLLIEEREGEFFGVGDPPYPGVLRKVVKLNGLHNVAVRKWMKTKEG